MPAPAPHPVHRLRSKWRAILRRKWWVATITLVTVGVTALVTWLLQPVYEGETTIRIDERKSVSLGFAMDDMMPMAGGSNPIAGLAGGDKLQADVLVLRSRSVAEVVVDSLDLHVVLKSPRLPRSSIVEVVYAPADLPEGTVELHRRADGTYALPQPGGDTAVVQVGDPFRAEGMILRLVPTVEETRPERIRVGIEKYREVVDDFQEDIRILRPDIDAPMLSVGYRTTDPKLAALVPEVVTDRFIEYKSERAKADGMRTMEFLQGQLASLDRQLAQAEATLKNYRVGAEIINPQAQSEEQVRQLAELQGRRNELVTEASSLEQLLARIARRSPEGVDISGYRQLAAFPAFLMNPTVQAIFASMIELENQRSEMQVLPNAQKSAVQALTTRIVQLERELHQLATGYLQSLESQLSAVEAALGRYNAELATIPAREVEFHRLAREQALLEQVYTLMETRLKEAEIKAAGEPTGVTVIDPAIVPEEPIYPDPAVNLPIALVAGLLLGIGAVLMRENLHPTVWTRDDVLISTAGAPVLAQIPAAAAHPNGNGRSRVWVRRSGEDRRKSIAAADPRSPVSQAYRALSANPALLRSESGPRVVMLTSPSIGDDGQENSAANLASALAQRGYQPLLVDADLRGGSMSRVVGGRPAPGLSEVLAGRASLDDALQQVDIRGAGPGALTYLAAGADPAEAAYLLGSEAFEALIEELRSRFSHVLVHTAPLSATPDAEFIGAHCDGSILVARSGVTERDTLHRASARLSELSIPVIGVILNGAETTVLSA